MKGTCPCGGVTVTVLRKPEFLNSCNCTLCFRLGGLWGYYAPSEVTVEGETKAFIRDDIEQFLQTNFCPTCSATVSWTSLKPYDRMGLNMRLFDPDELVGLPIRFPDGRADEGEGERPPARHEEVLFALDAPF
ncbi:aldehyde-activating protein [Altererythrobacter salegens]|uniref:Aldehyde-activating protein n=1 Tax=Croceibacterium salegens TaxID=1737568 RepID=A0A6I4T1G7_9SPHN|nr:aldehyde-activating protein [Croceibacterium salegens]MXO61318.1 aldehyde-activating protein [Croceibacterium salegens]